MNLHHTPRSASIYGLVHLYFWPCDDGQLFFSPDGCVYFEKVGVIRNVAALACSGHPEALDGLGLLKNVGLGMLLGGIAGCYKVALGHRQEC